MPKIVISYRRQDSEAIAGRIRDRLVGHYGSESVFMDIDSIPYGVDFRTHIQEALRNTDVLVAVIGPKWTGASRGRRARIREDNDPVRVEVERALASGIPVVPVLVNGARMLKVTDLPDSLVDLSYRNAAEVDAGRDFHQHVDRLIRSLDQILLNAATSRPPAAMATEAPPIVVGESPSLNEPGVKGRSDPLPDPVAGTPPEPEPPTTDTPRDAAVPGDGTAVQPATVRPGRRWAALLAIGAVCVVAFGGVYGYLRSVDFGSPVAAIPEKPGDPPASVPPPPAAATIDTGCKPSGAAAFYDDFETPDGGWGQSAAAYFFKDGQMVLSPKINASESWIYYPLLFKSATVCSEIISPAEIKNPEEEAAGGVIFWAINYENYYIAEIYANGSYGIWRRASGKWLTVVPRTPATSVRPGPNAVNQLKVATGSTRATLFANGAKLIDVWGQPPARGGAFGLYGQSEKDAANEWRFASIAVVEGTQEIVPPAPALLAPQAAAFLDSCKRNGSAAFFDGFSSPDPGWGASTDVRLFKDGQMVLRPPVNAPASWIFSPMIFRSGIVCADIKAPPQVEKVGSDAAGGVIFWASDYRNYYLATIYLDGSYAVFRNIDGRWATLLPRANAAGIHQGENAVNRVKINFANDAAMLAVNDTEITQVRHAQPPEAGGAVGLYAGSGDDTASEWSFLSIAVMEDSTPPASAQSDTPAAMSACKPSSPPAFADNFTTPDPGWGAPSPNVYFDNSQMVLKPKSSASASWIYKPMVFGNATICTQILSPRQVDKPENDEEGGLIFWATDIRNFYLSVIFVDGSYSVWRKVEGTWISVVPRARADSIRPGPDAANQMTVKTAANMASLFVNDAKLVDIWGQPPSKGGSVGLFAQSEDVRENEWRFTQIAVVEDKQPALTYSPAARAASIACKRAASPAFFDDFTPSDPGWGPVGQTYFFRDGQMVLKPKASTPEPWIYAPLIFSDATICSEFKFPSQSQPAETGGAAGIIFWAGGYKNYYLSMINVDGTYSVFRKIDGEWATVIPRTRSEAIRQGVDAVNRMKVVLDHNLASIVINDTAVITFHGQPANASGAVGLYAQSGEGSDSEWRFTNIVVSN